jgi:hypothetical protein
MATSYPAYLYASNIALGAFIAPSANNHIVPRQSGNRRLLWTSAIFKAGNVSEAKRAAEKGLDLTRPPEKLPSGPKGHVDFAAFTARLKPCPDTKHSF